jgi:signal peptidase I
MQPTVRDGDYLLVDVRAYQRQGPARFDVIIFDYPNDPRREFIKRVVGLPGETIRIHRGLILVDGRLLQEPYHPVVESEEYGPVTIPPGHLFVMGDNRPHSSDSRLWGPVVTWRIHGRAQWIVWPLRNAAVLS